MVEEWLRRPDSNRRCAAYETAALPLGYSAILRKMNGTSGCICQASGLYDLYQGVYPDRIPPVRAVD